MGYPVGTVLRCEVDFKDSASALYDPSTVWYYYEKPDGAEAHLVYGGSSGSVVRSGSGEYYVDLHLDTVGPWTWRFEGRDSASAIIQAAYEEGIVVEESDFYAVPSASTYAAPHDAAVYCREILRSERNFTRSTKVTEDQVKRFHDQAYATINAKLAAQGYTTPVDASSDVFAALTNLEALWVAAHVHDTALSATTKPSEVTKGDRLMMRFDRDLEALLKGDLTRLAGVTRSSKGTLYMGGISKDDKRGREQDTDRVKPRFARGMFSHSKRTSVDVTLTDPETD